MSLKYWINIIVVFLFSIQLLYRNAVIILYSQYKDEIASQYCENKLSSTNKECKGKCYLNKQIEEQSPQSTHEFNLSKLKSELFFQEFASFKVYLHISCTDTIYNPYSLSISSGIHYPITPPPKG